MDLLLTEPEGTRLDTQNTQGNSGAIQVNEDEYGPKIYVLNCEKDRPSYGNYTIGVSHISGRLPMNATIIINTSNSTNYHKMFTKVVELKEPQQIIDEVVRIVATNGSFNIQ